MKIKKYFLSKIHKDPTASENTAVKRPSKISFKSPLKWKQDLSLLPTCTVVVGITLAIFFAIILICNFIFIVLGVTLFAVVPSYKLGDILYYLAPQTNITGTEDEKYGNELLRKAFQVTISIGLSLFFLGLFSLIFIILGIIAICFRLNILFIIYLLGIVIICCILLGLSFNILAYIGSLVKSFLFSILIHDFKKEKCVLCNKSSNKTISDGMELFEKAMIICVGVLECCGVDSPKDYLPINDNKIPEMCTQPGGRNRPDNRPTPSGMTTTVTVDPPPSMKGCYETIMLKIKSFTFVLKWMKFVLLMSALVYLFICLLCIAETISFYLQIS